MKIEKEELNIEQHYLDKVTYVPSHAAADCGHTDCEQGVIIRFTEDTVFVLYSKSRTVQGTSPEDLVWG